MTDDDTWARVGARVRQRRQALRTATGDRLTQMQLAALSRTSESTVRSIETARRQSFDPSTLSALSYALGWTTDSIEVILAGGEPIEVSQQPRSVAVEGPVTRAEVDELRRRVDELTARLDERDRQQAAADLERDTAFEASEATRAVAAGAQKQAAAREQATRERAAPRSA